MIDKKANLSVKKQCILLRIARSTAYHRPKPVSDEDLQLMKEIDAIHMELPYYGSRRIAWLLRQKGYQVGRGHVSKLMRHMGICAIYCKKKLSKPCPDHKKYPYLLKNLEINGSNQVWATDITYIPMSRGFAYLIVVIDWHSRKALSWRLSNTMDVSFCVEALEEAIRTYGTPEIFNTDQGSQFTSNEFTGVLEENGIKISMDGRGRWLDNVFIERLWRSLKYEEVYLKAYESMPEAKMGIGNYLMHYNSRRPHQALKMNTPDQVYFDGLNLPLAA